MLNETAVARLRAVAEQYRNEIDKPVPENWAEKDNHSLWAAVLVQIAVAGKEAGGKALAAALSTKEAWHNALSRMTRPERANEIHRQLRAAGVRYVSAEIDKCKKTKAATYNFDVLAAHGGPKSYFTKIAGIPDENWRIAIVSDELAFVKNKGARDLLIGLGLVHNAIAFDVRIQNILEHVGACLPNDLPGNKIKYRQLEKEILEKVCTPCGMSGAHFDRILFAKHAEIVGNHRRTRRAGRPNHKVHRKAP